MRVGHIDGALPESLDCLVCALCRDYARRAEALLGDCVSTRTKVEFRYLNYKIADAAMEIVERQYVAIFIREIGYRTGYAHSSVEGMSETMYKKKKFDIKVNIARKLHFCD